MGNVLSLSKRNQFSNRASRSTGSNNSSGNRKNDTARFQMNMGRRYHNEKDVPYFLPNDNVEQDRLDALHFIMQELINGNHLCQLDNPLSILDIGAGTGTGFPDARVVGFDIAPIQPKAIRPPNVEFETMNILEGIQYEDNTFDYVHMRFLTSGIPKTYWPTLISDIARICSAGGAIELCETDGYFRNPGPLATKMNKWLATVCGLKKVDTEEVWKIPDMMPEAGLRVEHVEYYKLPMGSWCGPLGEMALSNIVTGFSGFRNKLVELCDETEESINEVFEKLNDEANERQMYMQMGVFVGRK
ncbi:S-adenosyl-L-methionine-dependent methyltransferase [Syncephalis plumigaleata]|nr:S-adenosyl-L-methionine-dependent methyltransferase [Syncephalis plumigaleata]